MKDSVKEQIEILNFRLNGIYQMIRLINEYNEKKSMLQNTEYCNYFEVMYSYINRYLILELYRMNDNATDCVSVSRLKNDFIRYFDDIVPKHNDDLYGHRFCNASKEEMNSFIKENLNDGIDKIQQKISKIRNKEGLAHGMPEKFDTYVAYDEIDRLVKAYTNVLWAIDERINNSHFAFGEGIVKYKSLSEMLSILAN